MKVASTKYWDIILSDNQYYLGRSILLLKRKCGMLSGLKENETKELCDLIKKMEKGVKKKFGATMFNWTCLMNDAYKSKNPKPQVHVHLMPRYKKKVKFAGEVFEDEVFAHHYDKTKEKRVSKKVLKEIRDKIKEILK